MPGLKTEYKRINDDIDSERFDVSRGAMIEYFAEREKIVVNGETSRGAWILYKLTGMGPIIVDHDKYANVLLVRIEIGKYEPLNRFKLVMSRRDFNQRRSTIITDAEFDFGGEWVGEYHEWDGQAVFTRKV